MKVSIGIRVNPNAVYYCIASEPSQENVELIQVDKINNPKSLDTPEQLKFLRATIGDILNENAISFACIRVTESNAQQINIPRIYMEGVIQELIASSPVEKYYVGQISSITSKLQIDRADFKLFTSAQKSFMGIEDWSKFNLEERESIIAAVSALNL